MKRSGILALWLILSLVSVVTSGCGYRVAATIQANAEATPVPTKLSWAAVPGPALSASAPETLSGLQTVSVPLATALSLYNWKWLSNPDQAAEADVLVRIWWMTDGPQYITERADPFYRPGLSFGTGIGFGSSPWHRGPFGYARQAFYVPEPSIQAIYSRVLVVEALRADALPKATLEALLPAAKPSGIASKPAPAAKPDGDPSKGPYAPPIALEGEALSKPPYAAPLKATGADPDQEPPYAPPLLASASQGVPGGAVLWRVVVTSGGSKGNTYEILPQLATAAAQAVGKADGDRRLALARGGGVDGGDQNELAPLLTGLFRRQAELGHIPAVGLQAFLAQAQLFCHPGNGLQGRRLCNFNIGTHGSSPSHGFSRRRAAR